MVAKRLLLILITFLIILIPTIGAATLDVSQPIQVTDNEYYERGQSIIYDGSNYWLFYGRSASVTGNYGNDNPDTHDYEVYYKKANSIPNLVGAAATRVADGDNENVYLGETDSAYYNGYVRVYASVDQGDGTAELYQWFSNDGGATWEKA